MRNAGEVEALWKRMYTYLHEDHIRPSLRDAIDGLHGCEASILAQAEKFSWRKRDKQAAAERFKHTLSELDSLLDRLTSNFYPFGSGMGVQTLVPIYELITCLRDDPKRKTAREYNAKYEDLGDRILEALRDQSHDDWIKYGGQVERLIAELHLAFHWTEDLGARAGSARHVGDRGSSLPSTRPPRPSRKTSPPRK